MNRTIDFHDEWKSIEEKLDKLKRIVEGSSESFKGDEYMLQYTKVYNLCTAKPTSKDAHEYNSKLYNKYQEFIVEYINSRVIPSLRDKSDELFLRELAKRWQNHKLMIKWLGRFFSYLDRYYVSRRSGLPLQELGLKCYRDLVYGKWKATNVVIDMINRERDEDLVDKALLKQAVDMYCDIGEDHYEQDFEVAMLDEADAYYSRKASQWIVEDSCPDYMIKVEECLKKEKIRVAQYMLSSSEPKLLERVLHQLLTMHCKELLMKENSGLRVLLRDDKMEDLSRMSRLFDKAKGMQLVADGLKQFVKDEGMALIKQADDAMSNKAEKSGGAAGAQALEFVSKVIKLYERFSGYVTDCFSGESLMRKAMTEAFEVFCNRTVGGCSLSEILASYCDDVLRKAAAEKLGAEAAEESLDKAVGLLVYISDKDLFAEFYRKKLSRRLLFERSGSDDHERFALSKMKQQYGSVFTSKLEGMVTDMALAKEKQSAFQRYLEFSGTNLGLDFSTTVITAGFWPTYKCCDLNLPEEMANCIQVFKDHTEGIPGGKRRYSWILSLGSCNIKGNFKKKTIELVVGTYQATVLLQFNDAERLSYSEIKKQLNMEDDDLIRVLFSLSCAKYKILKKDPDTKSVSQKDYFEFNSDFTDKMRRIKVAPPQPRSDERKKVVEDVGVERKHAIEAGIVRIMKSRKVMVYQNLIAECVQYLSKTFKPEVKDIKKRIEDLITREYLERDAENPNTFKYLA